jgi:hypothetical protein
LKNELAQVRQGWLTAQANPKSNRGFPAEVCESKRGDGEKVSPARS